MIATRSLLATWDAASVSTMPKGRICAQDGCGTRLSVYNRQPFCGLHSRGEEGPVPDGYMRCRICGDVLLWTTDFFHRTGDTLQTACKRCRNGRNRRRPSKALFLEEKHCPKCGRAKKLTEQYWYLTKSGAECGRWSSWCRVCTKDKNVAHSRAARRKEMVT